MLRRAAVPLAILAVLSVMTTPAEATTSQVSIQRSAFSPPSVRVSLGTTVKWTNSDSVAHTSTSQAGFWDSGTISAGGTFTTAFPSAGSYGYLCTIHGFTGAVHVRMAKKAATHGFTVIWSSPSNTPANRNFDVQVKRPGQTSFHPFRTATTARSAAFDPTTPGTYRFKARTRNTSPAGGVTGYSPVLTLTIS